MVNLSCKPQLNSHGFCSLLHVQHASRHIMSHSPIMGRQHSCGKTLARPVGRKPLNSHRLRWRSYCVLVLIFSLLAGPLVLTPLSLFPFSPGFDACCRTRALRSRSWSTTWSTTRRRPCAPSVPRWYVRGVTWRERAHAHAPAPAHTYTQRAHAHMRTHKPNTHALNTQTHAHNAHTQARRHLCTHAMHKGTQYAYPRAQTHAHSHPCAGHMCCFRGCQVQCMLSLHHPSQAFVALPC